MIKYLVFKYLRFDKTQPFIMLSALLAFLGVAIGLMVLIIAMAIMNGFDKEFERKLFTMNYPITIISLTKGGINDENVNELRSKITNLKFSPYITTQGVAKYGDRLEGVAVFGVDFKYEKDINKVVNDAIKDIKFDEFDALIGKGLSDMFLLSQNDKITLIFTKADAGGFSIMPKIKRFDVKSTFRSGLIAYDKSYVYVTNQALQKVLGYESGIYDGIHVYSKDPFNDIKTIKSQLPQNARAIGWWEQNGNFFSALKLEKRALFIVLMLIILVASLNIISSLLMTVMNRRQEIALLLALGASKSEIKKCFFCLGSVIGGGGIIIGVLLGLFGVWLLGSFDIVNLPADVYGSSKLPMELSILDFVMIVVGAIIIVAVSSYYPAKKATQVDVLQTLRNE